MNAFSPTPAAARASGPRPGTAFLADHRDVERVVGDNARGVERAHPDVTRVVPRRADTAVRSAAACPGGYGSEAGLVAGLRAGREDRLFGNGLVEVENVLPRGV